MPVISLKKRIRYFKRVQPEGKELVLMDQELEIGTRVNHRGDWLMLYNGQQVNAERFWMGGEEFFFLEAELRQEDYEFCEAR